MKYTALAHEIEQILPAPVGQRGKELSRCRASSESESFQKRMGQIAQTALSSQA